MWLVIIIYCIYDFIIIGHSESVRRQQKNGRWAACDPRASVWTTLMYC